MSAALLAEVGKVFGTIRGDFAQNCDALMPVSAQPGGDQSRVSAAIAVTESETVVPRETLSSAPTEKWNLQFVGVGPNGHRIIGAVRAGYDNAAFVDQLLEPSDCVLSRSPRQAIFGMDDKFVGPIEHLGLDGFVEGQAMDFVVATSRTVERGAQPTNLYRFHTRPIVHWMGDVGRSREKPISGDPPVRLVAPTTVWGLQCVVRPPSSRSTCPVMKDEASLAKKRAAGAISSGSAMRLIICAWTDAF